MPTVALYVTCLCDQLFPDVGKAVVEVLHRLGVTVTVPPGQTCCGQPAFNAGFRDDARPAAERVCQMRSALADTVDAIVVPSGSCALMMRRHYDELLPHMQEPAGPPVLEFCEYVAQRLEELGRATMPGAGAAQPVRLAYHASCHLLRGLGVDRAPRELLGSLTNVELVELDPRAECCGFGGTFSIKMPAISADMAHGKAAAATVLEADYVVAADLGCLMNIGGALRRGGHSVGTLHIAQVLAGPDHCRSLS